MVVKKKKELQKNNEYLCHIFNSANGAKITFETCNWTMDVLLHSLIECLWV